MDRDALRQARGGPAIGDIATHFIPPNFPGFEEAGGKAASGVDFLSKPNGRPGAVRQVLQGGRHEQRQVRGRTRRSRSLVTTTTRATRRCLVAADQLKQARVQGRRPQSVPHEDLVTEVCGIPKQQLDVCPNTGWLKDFYDPQTHARSSTFKGSADQAREQHELPAAERSRDRRGDGRGRGADRSGRRATRRGPRSTR